MKSFYKTTHFSYEFLPPGKYVLIYELPSSWPGWKILHNLHLPHKVCSASCHECAKSAKLKVPKLCTQRSSSTRNTALEVYEIGTLICQIIKIKATCLALFWQNSRLKFLEADLNNEEQKARNWVLRCISDARFALNLKGIHLNNNWK